MSSNFNFDEEVKTVDFWLWLKRVIGWDAVLPILMSMAAIGIAKALKHRPPADILALVGLPVVGFVIRLVAGSRQIWRNACVYIVQVLQIWALIFALFGLAVVDFFAALSAFVPPNNPRPDEITVVCLVATLYYLVLAMFAMYPGRRAVQYHE